MGVVSWAAWGCLLGSSHGCCCRWRWLERCSRSLSGIVAARCRWLIATRSLHIADANNFDFGSFLIAVLTSVVLLGLVERIDRMLPDRRRGDRERTV